MTKNSSLNKHQDDEFDFSEMIGYSGEEDAMVGMMSGLVEASRHQLEMSLELTKMILEKTSHTSMKEDEILSTFQRASQAIALNSPIRDLWEKMNT